MNTTFLKPVSNFPYLVLLQKCTTVLDLKHIHAQVITLGLARFTYITSRILASSVETGNIDYAQSVFSRIVAPTIFDYNSMIMGYSKSSSPQMGLSVYTFMQSQNVKPNSRTFPFLTKTCNCICSLYQVHNHIMKLGHGNDVYVISSLVYEFSKLGAMQLAYKVFDESLDKNAVCWTSLISGYCCNGLVDEARKVFDAMPERNDVSCSAMISGYVSNEHFEDAVQFFRELKHSAKVKLSSSMLISVLDACSAMGAFGEGKWVHSYIEENCYQYGLEVGTALIDFYAKCGVVGMAEEIFNKMPFKDVTTWSAMILGLAINGGNEVAISLFKEMEKRGPKPNAVTFVGILAACNHKILVKEAWRLFGRMGKVYGIFPTIQHYGCMVDLLSRAGRIAEAEILIKSMPMEPDGAIWCSFLNGCLIHGYIELGERAGELLIQLEPQHSGRYVLLANMYATKGSWEGVIRLRRMMKVHKVSAVPGWSSIEIDGAVHRFLVYDWSHSQAKDIHELLNQFNREITSSCHDSILV